MSTMATACVNAQTEAACALLNGGYLRLYSGPPPADADLPVGPSHVLLAELRFGEPAFGPAEGGRATAVPLPDFVLGAAATGTPIWFRAVTADGITPVLDGSVGVADADLVLATASIVQHAIVEVTSFTFAARK